MDALSRDQIEMAVEALKAFMDRRKFNQVEMEQLSNVNQSTISKILSGQLHPTVETLNKLFKALGYKLEHVLQEFAPTTNEIVGYLATPLTAVAANTRMDTELRRAVQAIKDIAAEEHYPSVPASFQLYWPGDYTHPVDHPQLSPAQVYLIDRSRASAFDFIILLCASPSYGVGQENEIATQAGLPAIRILPAKTSRMIKGSFLLARDVPFEGSLEAGLKIDETALRDGLRDVRKLYLRHRVLHGPKNGHSFGERLRCLLNDRAGDYRIFAEELGVSSSYLQALLDEPLAVTNPSACLLLRMAKLLHVGVGYLLGETAASDPVWTESMANWRKWADETLGKETQLALAIRDQWKQQYQQESRSLTTASYRNQRAKSMSENDWDRLYRSEGRTAQGSQPTKRSEQGNARRLL